MEKLGVGVIGPSGWGRNYCQSTQDSQKGKLVAIAGGKRAADTAQKFGVRFEESVESLCKADDVEMVAIASPHHLHPEHAICAAEHKKHALVEKPMATTVADCDRMIQAAKANGVKLMVAHSRRYFPIARKRRDGA